MKTHRNLHRTYFPTYEYVIDDEVIQINFGTNVVNIKEAIE